MNEQDMEKVSEVLGNTHTDICTWLCEGDETIGSVEHMSNVMKLSNILGQMDVHAHETKTRSPFHVMGLVLEETIRYRMAMTKYLTEIETMLDAIAEQYDDGSCC